MGHYCHDGLAALADVTSPVAALAEGLVKAVAVVYTLVSFWSCSSFHHWAGCQLAILVNLPGLAGPFIAVSCFAQGPLTMKGPSANAGARIVIGPDSLPFPCLCRVRG